MKSNRISNKKIVYRNIYKGYKYYITEGEENYEIYIILTDYQRWMLDSCTGEFYDFINNINDITAICLGLTYAEWYAPDNLFEIKENDYVIGWGLTDVSRLCRIDQIHKNYEDHPEFISRIKSYNPYNKSENISFADLWTIENLKREITLAIDRLEDYESKLPHKRIIKTVNKKIKGDVS